MTRNPITYLPCRTVIKFYPNHQPSNHNKIMSKTLLKTTFIDDAWAEKQPEAAPQDGEFWIVDVVHETCPGQAKGCFLVHPIRKIEPNMLNRLLPGMYDENMTDGCLILIPKAKGLHWLLPLSHRRQIKNVYAVMVQH